MVPPTQAGQNCMYSIKNCLGINQPPLSAVAGSSTCPEQGCGLGTEAVLGWLFGPLSLVYAHCVQKPRLAEGRRRTAARRRFEEKVMKISARALAAIIGAA